MMDGKVHDIFNIFTQVDDALNMDPDEYAKVYGEPKVGPHGRLVDVKWMAYGDLHIYEDGYEEYFSIGD